MDKSETDLSFFKDLEKPKGTKGVYCQWRTGGQAGGSCWDEGKHKHYPIDAEPEPDFEEFKEIILKVCPDISLVKYNKLHGEIVKEFSYTYYEYYGNYSEYSIKYFESKHLYDCLKENGII